MEGRQFIVGNVAYIFHHKIECHITKQVPGWVCSQQGTLYSKFFSDEELRAIAN
jgi:hypothetical protein